MAQCKFKEKDGSRCSNQAVPGIAYCQTHQKERRRVQFRKVPKAPAVKPAAKPTPPPAWTAVPAAADTPLTLPGLERDRRGIVVAAQGLIWLGESTDPDDTASLSARLTRLVSVLSQGLELPGQVNIHLTPANDGAAVRLTLGQPDQLDLAQVWDMAANAADLSGGLLYIGQAPVFVQYRDGGAPYGYHVAAKEAPQDDNFYLVDRNGTHPLPQSALKAAPLDRLVLGMGLLPAKTIEASYLAHILTTASLYPMLARYFQAHNLPFQVARFRIKGAADGAGGVPPLSPSPHARYETGGFVGENRPLVLFELAGTDEAIPAFVISYLQSLPRTVVLTALTRLAKRELLLEYGCALPGNADHLLAAFPDDSLILLMAADDFKNQVINPRPVFFNGDTLSQVSPRRLFQTQHRLQPNNKGLPLAVELQLVTASEPTPPTAAILLTHQELGWLNRMLFTLPAAAFANYHLATGESHAILLSRNGAVEGIPFGEPLRQMQQSRLFLPLHRQFQPKLSWAQISQALNLNQDYTFITKNYRLDVPSEAFQPLSRALQSVANRPRARLRATPPSDLPELVWDAAIDLPPIDEVGNVEWGEPGKENISQRPLLESQSPPPHRTVEFDPAPEIAMQPPTETDWLEQAESLLAAEDEIGAAILFVLAGKPNRAAKIFKAAAQPPKA